jgi:hypothetical protein
MTQSFLSGNSPNLTNTEPKATEEASPERERLKHLLIGSPKGVTREIHTLQVLGYAEVGSWSPLIPTANPGEVMSILMKYIRL